MNIQTPKTVHKIEENCYVTPFRTKAKGLFFIVSPGDSPAQAYQDCALFEGMTGLDSLAQPRLYRDFNISVLASRVALERYMADPVTFRKREVEEEGAPVAAILAAEADAVITSVVA